MWLKLEVKNENKNNLTEYIQNQHSLMHTNMYSNAHNFLPHKTDSAIWLFRMIKPNHLNGQTPKCPSILRITRT